MVAAWLLFSEVGVQEAEEALRSAKETLWNRDYLEDANILSLEGRFARQKGDFDAAVNKARQAIELFEDNKDGEHPNCARCYVHMAFAILLQAEARGLTIGSSELAISRQHAFETLKTAQAICLKRDYARVLDRVHYFRARWHLKFNNDPAALAEAKKAYEIAESAHDHILMAHALIAQCECARRRNDRSGGKTFGARSTHRSGKNR
jgi:tetratricopeptide (TPR) repeat protein